MKVLKYDLSITLQSDKMWWTFLNMVQRNQLKSVSKHEFSWGGVNWCTCTATWNENADERRLKGEFWIHSETELNENSQFVQMTQAENLLHFLTEWPFKINMHMYMQSLL